VRSHFLFFPKKGRIIAVRISTPKDTNPNIFLKTKIFLLSSKTEQESISTIKKKIKGKRKIIVEILRNFFIYLYALLSNILGLCILRYRSAK